MPDIEVILDEHFPIREAFLEQPSLLRQDVTLKLKLHPTVNELAVLYSGGVDSVTFDKSFTAQIPVAAEDKVCTLMLGSKPSKPAALAHLQSMIQLAKDHETQPQTYFFFLFCGQPETRGRHNELLESIYDELKTADLSKNLKVLPFTFQSDKELAPLLARSDVTITRSGGITAMELLHLNREERRQTLLHSEIITPDTPYSKYGIPGWEGGNAKYLIKKINAKIISPENSISVLNQSLFTI